MEQASQTLREALPLDLEAPVDLSTTLESFGVGHPLIEQGPGRHGGLRKVGSRWHPVIYRASVHDGPFSTRERFTIAHEIAHAVIDCEIALRPVRESQYWALEAICDEFASQLLIPERYVATTRHELFSAQSVLVGIRQVATATRTSLAASARRLLEGVSAASAWGVRSKTDARTDRTVYRVDWDAGARRHALRTGSHVRADNAIFSLVDGHRHGSPVTADGEGACHRTSRFFSLVSWWHSAELASQQQALPI